MLVAESLPRIATDPFTLQYVAGHDSIKTTVRYVHPREDAVENYLRGWGICRGRRLV